MGFQGWAQIHHLGAPRQQNPPKEGEYNTGGWISPARTTTATATATTTTTTTTTGTVHDGNIPGIQEQKQRQQTWKTKHVNRELSNEHSRHSFENPLCRFKFSICQIQHLLCHDCIFLAASFQCQFLVCYQICITSRANEFRLKVRPSSGWGTLQPCRQKTHHF